MKYNNIDVLISQKMTSIVPTNFVMYFTRVTDDEGIEPNLSNMIKIIKAFTLSKKIIEQSVLPVQLIEALKSFMNKNESEIINSDVEYLISLFDFFNYPFKIIGRLDLNGKVVEEETNDQMAYLINSYSGNNTETSGFYQGYAKLYDIKQIPHAMDFIEYFNLTADQISAYDLDIPTKTYITYKSENRLNDFDDTIPLEFIKSRKMDFVIERTV